MIQVITYMIDDNVLFMDAMRAWMEYEGIEGVEYFTSSEELILRLNRPVHVCVLDHGLSGSMTGLNLMRRIKKDHPHCYFIIMSGTEDIEVPIQFMNEGAHCFARKSWPDFIDKIRQFIKHYIAEATNDIEFAEHIRGY